MNRHERDPLEVARLIVSRHGYLTEVENRFTAMEQKMKDHIAGTRGRGGKSDLVRTRGKNEEEVWYDKHDGRTR